MAGEARKVLLVDDDVELLEALALYLKADRDIYELLLARSGSEAIEILANQTMAIVICDIVMQGVSGLEVLADVRVRHPQTEVILITAHASPKLQEEVKKSGCLHLIEKPFDPEKLRRLIRRELTRQEKGFIGTLRNIQLTDLIQMSCWSKLSTAIRVTQGSEQGLITIRDGQIVDAACEQSVGEEAFYRILSWKSGSFETLAVSPVRKQTIDKSWEFLILQGVRLADERASSGVEEAPSDEESPPATQPVGVRVLVVDDSPFMCRALSDVLAAAGDIAVVGKARNGAEALKKIEELNPDVITLDVNMPVMDGGTALKHIMIKRPCPVVIVSKVGAKSIDKVVDFLCLGAVDFFSKPSKGGDMEAHQQDLIRKIRTSASAKLENYKRVKTPPLVPNTGECGAAVGGCRSLVVINSGPGGYGELVRIIPALPRALQACVVAVQEMPAEFLIPFSLYLKSRSELAVAAPGSSSPLRHGCCYVGSAPGNFKVIARDEDYSLEVAQASGDETRRRGAIDPLLLSVAEEFPRSVLVVLLSGADIGSLEGFRKIKAKGGRIIAQTPSCSLVPQPLERVVQEKMVDLEAGSDEIVQHIMSHVGGES
ncbi:MAG TPA: response regulator [Syntrophobacteria bacterium]|nr:response regulator [Syntrophobacteria bacterium]